MPAAAEPRAARKTVAPAHSELMPFEGPRPITDHEFGLFRTLINDEAGIHLADTKRALLVGRLSRRLRILGLRTFKEYYRRIVDGDHEERVHMLDAITTNETHFFREPRQFDFIESELLPRWVAGVAKRPGGRQVRVWSAACSTGEEPYSLAMTLLWHLPPNAGWNVEIVATDLSTRALAAAQAAVWPLAKADEIPQRYLKRYMLRGTGPQEGKMKAGPEICAAVTFRKLNLNADAYPIAGPFDMIFCRNVLIYFKPEAKVRVIERLLEQLTPDGLLFLGHAESLTGLSERVRCVGPTVYTLRDTPPAGARR